LAIPALTMLYCRVLFKIEIMQVTLKELRKNGGKRKEYKFLTPVLDLIKKEYGEIMDSFTPDNYGEAIDEVMEKYTYIAVYESPELLKTAIKEKYRYEVSYKETKEEEKVLDPKKILIFISGFTSEYDETLTIDRGRWNRYTKNVSLNELYVITDNDAFEEFVVEFLVKREEEEVEAIRETGKLERETTKLERRRIELYGEDFKRNSMGIKAIELIEAFEEKDPKNKYKKVVEVLYDLKDDYTDSSCW